MTLIAIYPSKKVLKENIGKSLKYQETSMFGEEYTADGSFVVSNRPSIIKYDEKGVKEFFAHVTMKDGLIFKVM